MLVVFFAEIVVYFGLGVENERLATVSGAPDWMRDSYEGCKVCCCHLGEFSEAGEHCETEKRSFFGLSPVRTNDVPVRGSALDSRCHGRRFTEAARTERRRGRTTRNTEESDCSV